ncbi:hypothetical protein CYV19_04895 [Natronobacterium gregoryi SP2]|nr:hypothetical protein C490_12877 [Natronobacterium gregoryi SP2]PLK21378.1 hypothetical protein CYV19_04895 [Natronobacterium gregoryi SP2]
MDVVEYYKRGHEAYYDAEEHRKNRDFENAVYRYQVARDHFDTAKEWAENEEARRFCYEAREIARIYSEATEDQMFRVDRADDGSQYETADLQEFMDSDDQTTVEEYEIRGTAALERRTRIPSWLSGGE